MKILIFFLIVAALGTIIGAAFALAFGLYGLLLSIPICFMLGNLTGNILSDYMS